ncbi:MAG: CHRD domain-containing protein [Thermomicrobiales bacterium]
MSAEPQRTQGNSREEEPGTSLLPGSDSAWTRRASVILGSKLVAAAGALTAGLRGLSAEAKKKGKGKKKRRRKKKRPSDFRLEAENMTGGQEVPDPGDPDASGSGTFAIRPNGTICCEFEFDPGMVASDVTLVHIHEGAAGVQGDPVVDFNGQLETCVPISSNLANQIKANPAGFYANIHTEEFPNGAVRAQLSEA